MAGLVYLVLAALLASGLVPNRFGPELQRRLHAQLGPVRSLAVQVSEPTEPRGLGALGIISAVVDDVDARRLPLLELAPRPRERTVKGRIERIELRAEHVRLDTLQASEVSFIAEDVTYDLGTALADGSLRVTGIGRQLISVLLRDGDLDAHAAVAFPELMDPHITFEGGQVVARARVPVIFAAFDAVIRGQLAIADGRKVVLRDARLDTGRVELSDELRAQVLKRLDPLIDLDETFKFAVPLTWTEVAVGSGQARLSARVEPLVIPEPASDFQPRERYLR